MIFQDVSYSLEYTIAGHPSSRAIQQPNNADLAELQRIAEALIEAGFDVRLFRTVTSRETSEVVISSLPIRNLLKEESRT